MGFGARNSRLAHFNKQERTELTLPMSDEARRSAGNPFFLVDEIETDEKGSGSTEQWVGVGSLPWDSLDFRLKLQSPFFFQARFCRLEREVHVFKRGCPNECSGTHHSSRGTPPNSTTGLIVRDNYQLPIYLFIYYIYLFVYF